MMTKKEFYENCARLLAVNYEYSTFNDKIRFSQGRNLQTNANRWGGRDPGNGRFPERGLIRAYGENAIHISLHSPFILNTIAGSYNEALNILETKIREYEMGLQ